MTLEEAKIKTEKLIARISGGNYKEADKTALIYQLWDEMSDFGFVDNDDPQVHTGTWEGDADAMLKVLEDKFMN